jgi:hypothetical protein
MGCTHFPRLLRHDLSSLKQILYGASPINESLPDRAPAAFPGIEFELGRCTRWLCSRAARASDEELRLSL